MLLASLVCFGNQRVFCAIIVNRNALEIEIKIFSRYIAIVFMSSVSYRMKRDAMKFNLILFVLMVR